MADTIAREVFGLLFETSTEAVFIVDRGTQQIVSANVRAADMLARELGAVVGMSLAQLAYEPERELSKIDANRARYATAAELVSRRLAMLRYAAGDGT